MSLLKRLVSTHMCRSIYDSIAIDALDLIDAEDARVWQNVLLANYDDLLRGVRAPRAKFKDYTNHVLHTGAGEWGGARGAAMKWYAEAVRLLRAKKWQRATYALGVLSFYYSSVAQPLHAEQNDEKSTIHSAFERSLFYARSELKDRCEVNPGANITCDTDPAFVSLMISNAAIQARPQFQSIIDHYNFVEGSQSRADGFDETLLDTCAAYIHQSTHGFARLIDCAVEEAGVKAPKVPIKLLGLVTLPSVPLHRAGKARHLAKEGRAVARIFVEFERTGKALKSLSKSERELRKQHAQQVLRVELKDLDKRPLRRIGGACVTPLQDDPKDTVPAKSSHVAKQAPKPLVAEIEEGEIAPEFDSESQAQFDAASFEPLDAEIEAELTAQLEAELAAKMEAELAEEEGALVATDADDEFALEDEGDWAPGKLNPDALITDALLLDEKVDNLLHGAGLLTVEDLLCVDVDDLADYFVDEGITSQMIRDWQDQAMLMMRVGGLRAFDSEVLVATGIRSEADLAASSALDIVQSAKSFLSTSTDRRIVDEEEADIEEAEVQAWIDFAKSNGG